ncbi:hypothetical protein M1506_00645 [Patescibacteria group bacterium]|jgi:hypothetical protein|nr:hypothetical protein [Patescibacteria group bacterium]
MENLKKYRHGDLALIGIEKLPDGLKKAKTKVIIQSSGGNAHSIDKGDIYFKDVDEYIFGYLVAKNTSLYHKEHGEKRTDKSLKVARINDGVYKLCRQNEKTHEAMRRVED